MGRKTKLMRVIFVILVNVLTSVIADSSLECNILNSKSAALRLRRHLFCEYDNMVRPVVRKETPVNVSIFLAPKHMDFVDRTSTFILHTLLRTYWKDEHLTWNPEDFEGISTIKVKSDEIWVPDISVYNSGDMDTTQTGISKTMCLVSNEGNVICVPAVKYSSQCDTDYTYWPYDNQTCTIHMGSWTHTGEEININFKSDYPYNFTDYIPNKQWQLIKANTRKRSPKYNCCPNDTFPTLTFEFNMQRHSPMIHAAFVTPGIVLIAITLTVLWLDSRSLERISLAAVNFICHILCIYDLHWIVPSNGTSLPHILIFYRDSMALATFAMILTTLLRKIQASKVPAPTWIASTVQLIASNRAGRLFIVDAKELVNDLEDNPEGQESTPKNNQNDSWRKLAIILEWLGFFVTLFAYVLMLCLLIPSSGQYTRVK